MEGQRHHEIIRPIREIAQGLGEWVVNKIVPSEIFDNFVQGVSEESVKRTHSQLQFDDMGNYHNPDGMEV